MRIVNRIFQLEKDLAALREPIATLGRTEPRLERLESAVEDAAKTLDVLIRHFYGGVLGRELTDLEFAEEVAAFESFASEVETDSDGNLVVTPKAKAKFEGTHTVVGTITRDQQIFFLMKPTK